MSESVFWTGHRCFPVNFANFPGDCFWFLRIVFERCLENSPGQFRPDHTPSDEFCPENPPRYVSNQCVSLSGIICMSLVFGLQVAYNRLKPEQDLAFARDGKRYFHLLKATFMILVWKFIKVNKWNNRTRWTLNKAAQMKSVRCFLKILATFFWLHSFKGFGCSFWCGFIACLKPFKAPQKSVKIKIQVDFYFNTTF